MKRMLAYVLPYLAVAFTYMVLEAVLSPLGRTLAVIAAGAATLAASLATIVVLRRRQGRLSPLAFTMVSATCIALVLPAAHFGRLWTGGNSPVTELIIAVVPAMALLVALEVGLYTREEARALRAAMFAKKPESERS